MDRVVLLTKERMVCTLAASLVRDQFPQVEVLTGEPPQGWNPEGIDLLLSFYGGWVVPADVLAKVRRAALNIHPGSHHYPGFACYNLALYEGATLYGATLHHMAAKIDAGPIIDTMALPVYADDTVASLQRRTEAVALHLLVDLLHRLKHGVIPAASSLRWSRKASTRADLLVLQHVPREADALEVARRRRAVDYPGKPGLVFTVDHAVPAQTMEAAR